MIEQFRKPVTYLAMKLFAGGSAVMVDDLVNVAFAAIWKARARWDPRLSSFATYGMIKARSAMLDELRAMDHVPRLERARAKKEGRTLKKVESIEHDFTITSRPDRRFPIPALAAAASDLWRRLRSVVGPRGAEVLERYYRRDYTLKEIGQQLGLSESRVCQLHAQAVQRLQWKGKESIA